jgi:sensor histidine kinase YesM
MAPVRDRATDPEPAGVGLANTRARLARLYGADGTLDVAAAAGGGTEVRVTIPFRPALLAEERAR